MITKERLQYDIRELERQLERVQKDFMKSGKDMHLIKAEIKKEELSIRRLALNNLEVVEHCKNSLEQCHNSMARDVFQTVLDMLEAGVK